MVICATRVGKSAKDECGVQVGFIFFSVCMVAVLPPPPPSPFFFLLFGGWLLLDELVKARL